MYLNHAHRFLLNPQYPRAYTTDVKSSDVGAASYTFSAVNIGPLGQNIVRSASFDNESVMRTPSHKQISIIVHTEASSVTWTITSCTLGGVAGSKVVDRGGATNAINTAIFNFPPATITGITNTDVVVTPSKAMTSCAIGVVYIENMYIGNGSASAAASGTATAATNASTTLNTILPTLNYCSLAGSTCATGGGGETAIWGVSTANTNGSFAPTMLYEGWTANMAYSAAFQVAPGYGGNQGASMRLDWSGAGAFDFAVSCVR